MNMTDTLDCLLNFPPRESILICGNHGIGKSDIVKQAARTLNAPCVDFRLSQNDVGDLKGMPFLVDGRTKFAPPEWFPIKRADEVTKEDMKKLVTTIGSGMYGDIGYLFLDEINRATREVRQAGFELILDHRLNMIDLPDGWRVVSAVNDEDDVYQVDCLDLAFLSRFFIIHLNPTIEEWLAWAIKNGVHPVVIEFIRKNETLLDPTTAQLKEASVKGIVKVQDRRAWHKFSNVINKYAEDYQAGHRKMDPLSKDPKAINWLYQIAGGYVGTIAQNRFKSFLETEYQTFDANTILNKWDKSVEDRLKTIIKSDRIIEMGAYNELVVVWIEENIKVNKLEALSKDQSLNLSRYVSLLPNELVNNLWMNMLKRCKEIGNNWYDGKDHRGKPNHEYILNATLTPKGGFSKKVTASV